MKIKIWHDDIRRPPDDTWGWARTNKEAQVALLGFEVEEISLDHDLGAHDVDPDAPDSIFIAGRSLETGMDLVEWMCERDLVPPKVTIHSWNPDGAKRMAARLNYFGHDCKLAPFVVPK